MKRPTLQLYGEDGKYTTGALHALATLRAAGVGAVSTGQLLSEVVECIVPGATTRKGKKKKDKRNTPPRIGKKTVNRTVHISGPLVTERALRAGAESGEGGT